MVTVISVSQTYGSWPSQVTFSANKYQYSIYCNYQSAFNAQAAIYSSNGQTLIGTTEEKTLTTVNGWVTFNFITQPTLTASTNYVLAIEASDTSNVNVYYDGGTAEYFGHSANYPTWPNTLNDQSSTRRYSIYCNYSQPSQYSAQVEFTGNSSTPFPWNDLAWTIDSSASTDSVNATFQLYNATIGQYPNSGDGYMTTTIGTRRFNKTADNNC